MRLCVTARPRFLVALPCFRVTPIVATVVYKGRIAGYSRLLGLGLRSFFCPGLVLVLVLVFLPEI